MSGKYLLIGVPVAVAILAAWWFFIPPNPLSVSADRVRAVQVQFDPRNKDVTQPVSAASEDPAAIAALVAVVRSGRGTGDHKCGSSGTIRFSLSNGATGALEFLPGHDSEWYELRANGWAYRVPRAEFASAMRAVGVEVPMHCR